MLKEQERSFGHEASVGAIDDFFLHLEKNSTIADAW
jgi:hypothetical protein